LSPGRSAGLATTVASGEPVFCSDVSARFNVKARDEEIRVKHQGV
jgi:hypothetical protein